MKGKASELRTRSLSLQPFEERDRADAVAILRNEEIKKTYMVPDFSSDEEAGRLFERLMCLSENAARFVYGIRLDGQLIGFVNEVEIDGGTVEVGYVIHPNWKNCGYATEALEACVQELLRMGYSAVRAGVFEENTASRRVIEKCGLKPVEKTDEIEYRGRTHRCIYFETVG